MKTIIAYKSVQTQIHSLFAVAAVLAAHLASGASDKADAKKPVVTSGPILIDWTLGSEWRKKVAQEAKRVEPTAKVAPPNFGRDKMKVKARLLQPREPGKKPELPGAPRK